MRLTALLLSFSIFLSVFSPLALADEEETLTVSATIPAQASDFQNEIETLTTGSPFGPDKEIEYQITYGNLLLYPTTFTVETQWYQGTISGNSTPSVDVVNYVVGSATNGYNSASPVVNTTNKTISWNVTVPGNTQDQTVSFKLKTTSNYTGSNTITFPVKSRILGPGVTTPDETVTLSYLYPQANTSSSSPTPTSTSNPSSTPVSTFTINEVEMRGISTQTAQIFISTSVGTNVNLTYGTSRTLLNRSISSLSGSKDHLITLSALNPNTTYFFRLVVSAAGHQNVTSEIFTFSTAKAEARAKINLESLIAISKDIVILDSSRQQNRVAVLPSNTEFQFEFFLTDTSSVKNIQAFLRSKNVLGISSFLTDDVSANTQSVDLVQLSNGKYTARLRTPQKPGSYELYIRITEYNGGINEIKLADIKVVSPFTVLSKNNEPIEGARVYFLLYNETTRLYEAIPQQAFALKNPSYTNSKGELDIVLPKGKYKARIEDLSYKNQEIEFSLHEEGSYPIVYLERSQITPVSFFTYHVNNFNDVYLNSTKTYLAELATSLRFFDLLAALSLGSLVLITVLSFAKRHEIPFSSIHHHINYILSGKKKRENYIRGVVKDDEGHEVAGANVYLVNENAEEIQKATKTNRSGEFFFKKSELSKEYLVMAMKEGYGTHPLVKYIPGNDLSIKIERTAHHHPPIHYLLHVFTGSFGLSFEAFLILSLLFELLFLDTFGITKTLPYFSITLLNFIAWIVFIRHHNHQAKIAY